MDSCSFKKKITEQKYIDWELVSKLDDMALSAAMFPNISKTLKKTPKT